MHGRHLLMVLLMSLIFSNCGEISSQDQQSLELAATFVATEPPCNSVQANKLIYHENQFKLCNNGTWSPISVDTDTLAQVACSTNGNVLTWQSATSNWTCAESSSIPSCSSTSDVLSWNGGEWVCTEGVILQSQITLPNGQACQSGGVTLCYNTLATPSRRVYCDDGLGCS